MGRLWGPKSSQNRSRIGSGADFASETVFDPILIPFWAQLGAILGAKIEPCWGHVDQNIDFLRVQKAPENKHDFQHLSKPSWGRFWDDFGTENRPKIDPETTSRAKKQQKAKMLKNHWFFNVFCASEGSKINQKSIKLGS